MTVEGASRTGAVGQERRTVRAERLWRRNMRSGLALPKTLIILLK